MRKTIIPILMGLILIMSGCSSQGTEKTSGSNEEQPAKQQETEENHQESDQSDADQQDVMSATITYQSENGPIEVPAKAERIVVLSTFTSGSVMALNGPIVGIDEWSTNNPKYQDYIKDAVVVSDESLEKIIELNPDLIIVPSSSKNIEKLKKIAPTVSYTYGKVDYLTKFLEIGKLLNKEEEAQAWIDDFKTRASEAGKEIKAKIGEDATISVIEAFEKQLYVYGDNWGRGTEIIYQEMELNMPEKVKEMAMKDGYYAISPEVLPEFAGDYVIFSKDSEADNAFQETETYKNIPAVKNNRVFEVEAKVNYYNDPISLDFQLEFIKESLLGN